jgi:hypothetical protein
MNIYERVRRQLAKQEAAAKQAAAAPANRSAAARRAAITRRERRDDGIIDGSIMPRNAREDELQFRALYGDIDDELPS